MHKPKEKEKKRTKDKIARFTSDTRLFACSKSDLIPHLYAKKENDNAVAQGICSFLFQLTACNS
jgi:hypothetical protein